CSAAPVRWPSSASTGRRRRSRQPTPHEIRNRTPDGTRRYSTKGRERDMTMTSAHQDLIEQLEQAFAQSDIRQRAETLRRLTDLFVTSAETFTDDQIELFDEVMIRLVEEIDVAARAVFGRRLAEVAQAPPRVMRGLALDDAIEVAGPVLRGSDRLEDE